MNIWFESFVEAEPILLLHVKLDQRIHDFGGVCFDFWFIRCSKFRR